VAGVVILGDGELVVMGEGVSESMALTEDTITTDKKRVDNFFIMLLLRIDLKNTIYNVS